VDDESTSVRFSKIFNWTFILVVAMTGASFLLLTVFYPLLFTIPLSGLETRALNICDWMLKSGAGALIGLLMGRFSP
jgi:hypothetical protein